MPLETVLHLTSVSPGGSNCFEQFAGSHPSHITPQFLDVPKESPQGSGEQRWQAAAPIYCCLQISKTWGRPCSFDSNLFQILPLLVPNFFQNSRQWNLSKQTPVTALLTLWQTAVKGQLSPEEGRREDKMEASFPEATPVNSLTSCFINLWDFQGVDQQRVTSAN